MTKCSDIQHKTTLKLGLSVITIMFCGYVRFILRRLQIRKLLQKALEKPKIYYLL